MRRGGLCPLQLQLLPVVGLLPALLELTRALALPDAGRHGRNQFRPGELRLLSALPLDGAQPGECGFQWRSGLGAARLARVPNS